MDVYEINTKAEDHKSIYITRKFDAMTRQATATPRVSHLEHYTSQPYMRTITWSNVTVCSNEEKEKIKLLLKLRIKPQHCQTGNWTQDSNAKLNTRMERLKLCKLLKTPTPAQNDIELRCTVWKEVEVS